jgi:L-2-hydroxyglutarate oxidase LhgO
LEVAGGILSLNAPVNWVQVKANGFRINIGGSGSMMLDTKLLVNSTGLHMVETLGSIEGFPAENIPTLTFAKGNYFSLSGRSPFSHLIYPVPERAGLGIHATLDLAGQVRFGPDVEWVEQPDYRVPAERLDTLYEAISTYFPGIDRSRFKR